MPFSDVAAQIVWRSPQNTWNLVQGANVSDVSDIDKTLILQYLEQLYTGSPTAKTMLDDAAAAGPIRIGTSDLDNPGFAAGRIGLAGSYLGFNLHAIDNLHYFTKQGSFVAEKYQITIAHEFAHYVFGVSYKDPEYDLTAMNGSAYDFDGNIIRKQNEISTEMGYTANLQASYHSSVMTGVLSQDTRFAQLSVGTNYTDGKDVDVVRLGDMPGAAGNNLIDHTSRQDNPPSVLLRDLIFGFSGNDTIRAGKGDDFVYGGDDADTIDGGEGSDVLVGEAGNDVFIGSSGSDSIWGGKEGEDANAEDGMDTVDFSGSSSAVNISYSGTASDFSLSASQGGDSATLESIEKIVGTLKRDIFTYSGDIPSGVSITIDALAGQTGNDIINLDEATSGLKLTINNDGTGDLKSTTTNGQINLLNFHTQVVGSAHDDELTDNSSGSKKIDGGEGNDEISVEEADGDAMLLGGGGADIIRGGAGNDILEGDPWLGHGDQANELYGGAGSDLLISWSLVDSLFGGDGHDWIKLNHGWTLPEVRSGAGNDVIESTANNVTIDVRFGVDDGHDTVLGGRSDDLSYTTANVILDGLSASDVKIVINCTPNANGHYSGRADIALVVKSTGASIFVPDVRVYVNFNERNTESFCGININGTSASWLTEGLTWEVGDTSQYDVARDDYAAATADGPGDNDGSPGDDNLEGGRGDDALSGGEGSDNFEASAGSDAIDGGSGTDVYNLMGQRYEYQIERIGGSIKVTDHGGSEGVATLTSVEGIYFARENELYTVQDLFGYVGTEGADILVGSKLDNELDGLGGDDLLDGGAGDDLMFGGEGIDTARFAGTLSDYSVSLDSDGFVFVSAISAAADSGSDRLDGIEWLLFEGDNQLVALTALTLSGTSGDDTLVGGFGADMIDALGGHDHLTGYLGNDVLIGGDGDDTFVGGGGSDRLTGGAGNDTAVLEGVASDYLIWFHHSDGSLRVADYGEDREFATDRLFDIETLSFAGDQSTLSTASLPQLGTTGDDVIQGSARRDRLYGLGGNDTLSGGDGSDELDGGLGADSMTGGAGGDSYVVDNAGDIVIEVAGGGDDFVEAYVSYTLSANVEELQLDGESHISGTGNGLDNWISGNDGNNSLYGMAGDDTLQGGEGDDFIDGGDGVDQVEYWGAYEDYLIEHQLDGSVRIFDLGGSDGIDTLQGVEFAYFGDIGLLVDLSPPEGGPGGPLGMMADGNTGSEPFEGSSQSGWKIDSYEASNPVHEVAGRSHEWNYFVLPEVVIA